MILKIVWPRVASTGCVSSKQMQQSRHRQQSGLSQGIRYLVQEEGVQWEGEGRKNRKHRESLELECDLKMGI